MTKNQKIGVALGIAAILGYVLYKRNNETPTKTGETIFSEKLELPPMSVSSGSETPQVSIVNTPVNIPPQFGGKEVVVNSYNPETAGSWATFN